MRTIATLGILALAVAILTPRAVAQDDPTTPDDDAAAASPRPEKLLRGWPLLQIERGPEDGFEVDAIFSLYNYHRTPTTRAIRIAPVYFSGSESDSEWTLFMPLYYRDREPDRWRWLSLPLGIGEDHGETWWQAPIGLPLYSGKSSDRGRSERLGVWPLFDIFGRDRSVDGLKLDLLGLLSWRDPGESFLPIVRIQTTASGDWRKAALFPIFDYSNTGTPTSPSHRLLLPFLGWTESVHADERRSDFWPAWSWYERTPTSSGWGIAGGLFGGQQQLVGGESTWQLRIEPIYSGSRDIGSGHDRVMWLWGRAWRDADDYSAIEVIPPLGRFESWRGGYRQRLLPFYFASGSGAVEDGEDAIPEASQLLIAPFYYHAKQAGRTRRFVFPTYYSESSADQGTRVALPLYWHSWTKSHSQLHLLPIYSRIREGDVTSHYVLGPLYLHESSDGEDALRDDALLWPLTEFRRSRTGSHFHVLPFVWSTREESSSFLVVPPIYLRSRTPTAEHDWFLPIYGRYATTNLNGASQDRRFYAGGVLSTATRSTGDPTEGTTESWSLLGPLAGYSSNATTGATHSRLLPIWWQTRTTGANKTIALPFYVGTESGTGDAETRRRFWFGNLWVDLATPERRDVGFLYPLTRYTRTRERRRLDIFGIFGATRGDRDSTRLSPLTYFDDHAAPSAHQQWWHVYSDSSGGWGRQQRVMPFLFDRVTTATHATTNALIALYHNDREIGDDDNVDRSYERWLAPFYYESSDRTGDQVRSHTLGLFPIYYGVERPLDRERMRAIAFPLYWQRKRGIGSDDPEFEFNLLGGLVHADWSDAHRSSRIVPLYSMSSHDDGSGHFALSALFSSATLPPNEETKGLLSRDGYLGLQLIRTTRGEHSRTFVLNPFLIGYHRDDAADESDLYNLLLLQRYRRRGRESSYTALGLFHGASNPQRSWNSVFPLYYRTDYRANRLPTFHLPSMLHLYSSLENDRESRWSILGYLADGQRSKNSSDGYFRILYKGVSFLKSGSYRERVVQPLFTWEHDDANGRSYFSLLKFVYISKRHGESAPTRRYLLGIPLQW